MSSADLPFQLNERVSCSIAAAARYGIPANLMLAVAEKEAGTPGLWMKNTNGTSDVGPMQFNTAYLSALAQYGITSQAVAAPGCYAYDLAAWRLRQHLRLDQGDLWTRAANYHSRTPRYNIRYRLDLITRATHWATWLQHCAAKECLQAPTHRPEGTEPRTATGPAERPLAMPYYTPRMITPAPTP
ncbi:transglycosylase SLT domain-containing protein [Rugamonas rivuli]|uniref:Transglycosylase SLT domain-containing protein n=1 Tax=Rugamonas rivuli TaxID=2743358 RepID=A0A843SB02_9BURK|nr:transglycosylase SLT domain-containing protein [Rugamonas rivuli]MQA21665.1 transglycosylase SLT domain-containing protein [Rugamonas rivuli]